MFARIVVLAKDGTWRACIRKAGVRVRGPGRASRGEAEVDMARLQDAGKEGLTALSAAEKELRAAVSLTQKDVENDGSDSASRAKRREHAALTKCLLVTERYPVATHSLTHSAIIAWPPENHSLNKCACGVIL